MKGWGGERGAGRVWGRGVLHAGTFIVTFTCSLVFYLCGRTVALWTMALCLVMLNFMPLLGQRPATLHRPALAWRLSLAGSDMNSL